MHVHACMHVAAHPSLLEPTRSALDVEAELRKALPVQVDAQHRPIRPVRPLYVLAPSVFTAQVDRQPATHIATLLIADLLTHGPGARLQPRLKGPRAQDETDEWCQLAAVRDVMPHSQHAIAAAAAARGCK